MISRQTLSAPFAALLLLGMAAGAAHAATQHKTHAMGQTHSSRMHGKSTASRGSSSQDHMADKLNAQSLQRANAGSMQQPMQPPMGQAPMGQAPMGQAPMGKPPMAQPGMAPAQGTAQ